MSYKKTTHVFTSEELEELKEETGEDNGFDALKKWAYNQYPLRSAGYMSLGAIKYDSEGGRITIIER